MKRDNRYAIFDWDNTVREGYTLFSWVEYLFNHSIFNCSIIRDLEMVKEAYERGSITHDQFAFKACNRYSNALQGIEEYRINSVVNDYFLLDQAYIFNWVNDLFFELRTRNIDIIIVSGAPSIVLNCYKIKYGIKMVFAFQEEVKNGFYTGKVKSNFGCDKSFVVTNLIHEYHSPPWIAFGDSESDLPMLDAAYNSFCLNTNLRSHKPYITIGRNTSYIDIIRTIKWQ